jgi:hypothetical protein
MDNIKAMDDLIRAMKLTRKECELFKDLILEIKDHEEQIPQCSQDTRENLNGFSEEIDIILEQTNILSTLLVEALVEMETQYLRSLPTDRFYHE